MNPSQRRVVVVIAVVLVVVAAIVVNATQRANAPQGHPHKGDRGGPTSVLLSGAAGGVIVFVLTETAGAVARTRQRGRELRGLSRVLWPEMRRNWLAASSLQNWHIGRDTSKDDHPIREAWLDTRKKLSELMREEDFDALARYYADLELLEVAVTNNRPSVTLYATKAKDHEDRAMRAVEGYCNARWRPWGYRPGPTSGGWWDRIRVPIDE